MKRVTSRRLFVGALGTTAAGFVSSLARPLRADDAKPDAENGDRTILIVPLGRVPDVEVRTVERALASFYSRRIEVAPDRALPRAAFYPPRNRYRAERLLKDLEARAPARALRVLGLASVDISTTKGNVQDWGILGLATIDGRVGVLSSFRCRRGAKNAHHVAHRLGKTAVHELGHTFGLEHCPNRGCLMEDGQGTVSTTDRECHLCADCRAKLARDHVLAEPRREPPWPCA
jgi:archaemetzincin